MSVCNLLQSFIEQYKSFGPLFYNTFHYLLAAQCILAPNSINNNDVESFDQIIQDKYDFIIIGGGTAGSIVASRLAEIVDWNILVLEAGGEPTIATEIPALFVNNYETNEDWNFRTEPQEQACLSYHERRCYWPRGKVLGGTSSINGMYYITGNEKDFKDLAYISEEWSYNNLKQYLLSADSFDYDTKRNKGNKKHLHLEYDLNRDPIEDIIIHAHDELAFNLVEEFKISNRKASIGIAPFAIKSGVRDSTYNAYLKNLKNKVKILKNVKVNDITVIYKMWNQTQSANKVRFSRMDNPEKNYEVEAKKEIILSAGTINSPCILLHSGIRPSEGVLIRNKTLVNLQVGKNLQDHIFVPVMFKMKSNDDSNSLDNIIKNLNEYVTDKIGPLRSMKPQRVVSFINTTDINSNDADIQNHFIVAYPNQSNFVDMFIHHKLSNKIYKQFNEVNRNHTIVIVYVTLLQPKSRGSIDLNENGEVLINANYLDEDEDLNTLVRGMKLAMKLNDTKAFKKSGLELFWIEIDACKWLENDEFCKCFIRHFTGTLNHAVGTNKMGYDDKAVVDERLRVKGVQNLRVIDASVIPKIPRSNTMSHVIMFAENGAEMIKQDWIK